MSRLKDWKLRTRREMRVTAVANRAMQAFSQIRNAMVFVFPPPAVTELGNAKGIDFQLQDRGGSRPRGSDGGSQAAS